MMILRPIDTGLLAPTAAAAAASPRRRAIYRFHAHPDPVQRMINVVQPDSYVHPHRHQDPDKVEAFICLRGRAVVLLFDDAGQPLEGVEIAPAGPAYGVEVPPRVWHALLALEETALYEVIEGPYQPETHKSLATWAPTDPPAGLTFLRAALTLVRKRDATAQTAAD